MSQPTSEVSPLVKEIETFYNLYMRPDPTKRAADVFTTFKNVRDLVKKHNQGATSLETIVALGNFLVALDNASASREDIKKYGDSASDWKNEFNDALWGCQLSDAKNLRDICKGAVGIILARADFLKDSLLENGAEVFRFINNRLIMHKQMINSAVYQPFLETVGIIFFVRILELRGVDLNIIEEWEKTRDVLASKSNANSASETNSKDQLIEFVRLFTTICRKYEGEKWKICGDSEAANVFAALARKASKSNNKLLFKRMLDLLTGLSVDGKVPDILDADCIENIGKELEELTKKNPEDTYDKTHESDWLLIEAKMDFYGASNYTLQEGAGNLDLFALIRSKVPCSVKGKCLSLIGTLGGNDTWSKLEEEALIPANMELNEGLLIDVNDTQAREKPRVLWIERGCARMIRELIHKEVEPPSGDLFAIYNKFLIYGLGNAKKITIESIEDHWKESEDEKWSTIIDICDTWTTALTCSERFWPNYARQVFHSAKEDTLFEYLFEILSENTIPLSAKEACLRVITLLCESETSFMERERKEGSQVFSSFAHQIQKIAWQNSHVTTRDGTSSSGLIKILEATTDPNPNVRIYAINLLKFVTPTSDTIQNLLNQGQTAVNACKTLLNTEEDSEVNGSIKNSRTLMMEFLLSLDQSSELLRAIVGFEQNDPPHSVINSKLESGIFPDLMGLCKNTEKTKNYPYFVSLVIKLIYHLCKNSVTKPAILSRLRLDTTFFRKVLSLISGWLHSNMSRKKEGHDYTYLRSKYRKTAQYYLMILACEGMGDGTDTTKDLFKELFTPSGLDGKKKHSVLIYDIADLAADSSIIKGLRELAMAYTEGKKNLLKDNEMKMICREFVLILLRQIKHVPTTPDGKKEMKVTRRISETASIIVEKVLSPDILASSDDLFKLCLESIIYMDNMGHVWSRLGIYAILCKVMHAIGKDSMSVRRSQFKQYENNIIRTLSKDILNDVTVIRMAAYATVEALMLVDPHNVLENTTLCSHKVMTPIVKVLIENIANDWDQYTTDKQGARMCLTEKCSFISRFIATSKDYEEDCHFLIDDNLIGKLADNEFWRSAKDNPTDLEYMILRVMALMAYAFNDNELVQMSIAMFLEKYHDTINGLLKLPTRNTGNRINRQYNINEQVIVDIASLLSGFEKVEKMNKAWWKIIPELFKRIADTNNKNDNEYEIMNSLISVMARMSTIDTLFVPTNSRRSTDGQTLLCVTTYIKGLLEMNEHRDDVIDSAFLIVWNHIEQWKDYHQQEMLSTDDLKDEIKTLFGGSNVFGKCKSYIANMILRKLGQYNPEFNKL